MSTLVAVFANREDASVGIGTLMGSGLPSQQLGYIDGTDADPVFREELEAGRVLVSAEVPDLQTEISSAETLIASKALMVTSLVTARQRVLAA